MQLLNTPQSYGAVSVWLHWVVALAVFALFGLGFWMVDLTYYDPWYRTGPDIHRSVGILLFVAVLARLAWRLLSPVPKALPTHQRWEVITAHLAHGLLYVLMLAAMISGYLISTADGSAIQVFELFQVPSVTGRLRGIEDTAGVVHYWSTWGLIGLAGVHALAALKHHVIDRDNTLRRMVGMKSR
jgi:cytochrome b561